MCVCRWQHPPDPTAAAGRCLQAQHTHAQAQSTHTHTHKWHPGINVPGWWWLLMTRGGLPGHEMDVALTPGVWEEVAPTAGDGSPCSGRANPKVRQGETT